MDETEFGYLWDVSWSTDIQQDVVYIDTGNDTQIYLSRSDLLAMMETLNE